MFRTSSFRLTLLYAAITGASWLLLFGVVLWSATRFMEHQLDRSVAAEIAEMRTVAGSDRPDDLKQFVDPRASGPRPSDAPRSSGGSRSKEAGGFFYLVQDAAGTVLAGDLPHLDPLPGIREWRGEQRLAAYPRIDIRGRGVPIADGGYLFVGANAHEIHELRESLSRSFLLGFAAAMLLVLVGGAGMSLLVLRRIETMSQVSRDIVNDRLEQRLPLTGSGDEFDHLAVSLNAMLDRIQGLLDGLRQVSTDIAHDLRTPLTRLRQRLELALGQATDVGSLQATLHATVADIDSILATFAALLRIAQVEAGAGSAQFQPVDLSGLLDTVAEVYQPSFEEKGQQFTAEIERGLTAQGDRELLTQMFANLVENASVHAPRGARIVLGAVKREAGAEVSVADNGPGIPAAMREKVLQRFVRLDASRSTPGNGLGLSLVAAIAMLHHAALTLEDNAPGLVVRVALRA